MGHQISHLKINFVLLSALVWNWIIVQLQYSFCGIFAHFSFNTDKTVSVKKIDAQFLM